jgi:hypothetical protein
MSVILDVRRCLMRDLSGFVAELEGYPDDASVWALPPGFVNATGTLALHAAGNLRHFVGHVLGGTDYVRDRQREFAARDVPRVALIDDLETARREVDEALRELDPARADQPFPVPLGPVTVSTSRALIHLTAHLGWHLGQADYHRRVVTGVAVPVDAMGLATLVDP